MIIVKNVVFAFIMSLFFISLTVRASIPAFTDPSKINFALHDPGQLLRNANQGLDYIVSQLEKRTSMRLYHSPATLITPENIYQYPILFVPVCHQSLKQMFPQENFLGTLKNFVEAGGTIFFFECAQETMIFEEIQKDLSKVFSRNNIFERIFKTHALYRSFYLVKENLGCKYKEEFLHGFDSSGRTAIFYFRNDLLNLAAGNCDTQQREMANRTFTNLFMYALTLDYKLDQVHLPEILNRRY